MFNIYAADKTSLNFMAAKSDEGTAKDWARAWSKYSGAIFFVGSETETTIEVFEDCIFRNGKLDSKRMPSWCQK